MKEFIQAILISFIAIATFMYILLNGYPEPFGLIIGIIFGVFGTVIAGKEVLRCLR